jgi:flagellar biosynthetic protein FliO
MMTYYTPGLEKVCIVLAFIGISYIVFKKIIKKNHFQGSEVKVLSVVPVGQKEKLVVCQVKDKKFIMGVTQHSISHLHTFDAENSETELNSEVTNKNYNPYFT